MARGTQPGVRVRVLGHRGAPLAAQENTVAAFQAAASQGADGVELDVRRTADGVLVVHHDAVVPGFGPVCSMRVAELPPWLLRLGDALDACEDMAIVNVEIKNSPVDPDFDTERSLATDLARMLAERPTPPVGPGLLVSSFDLLSIDAHRREAPGLATGWLTLAGYDQEAAVATVAEGGHTSLHPQESSVTEELVGAAHDHGLALMVWTVDDPSRAAELARWGVDGIISNVPAVVLAAIGRGPQAAG